MLVENRKSVVMMGATGAVGTQVVKALIKEDLVDRLTLLGRNEFTAITDLRIEQHNIDIKAPKSYVQYIGNHDTAICTLGVGQPSKVKRKEFTAVDRTAVFDFAKACRNSDVRHFQLLSSVAANAKSNSFYLRSKGELEKDLKALKFEHLSLFHPSMILTPENRYGKMQGLTLALWPRLDPLLTGPFRKFRGIGVEGLGCAIARNTVRPGRQVQILTWKHFRKLADN